MVKIISENLALITKAENFSMDQKPRMRTVGRYSSWSQLRGWSALLAGPIYVSIVVVVLGAIVAIFRL